MSAKQGDREGGVSYASRLKFNNFQDFFLFAEENLA